MNKLQIHRFTELNTKIFEEPNRVYDSVEIFLNADEEGAKFAGDMDMMGKFDKALSCVKNTKYLIDLDVRDNYLNDKKLSGIVTLIENNPLISELRLIFPSNFITERGFKDLMVAIGGNLKELRSLTINVDWNFHIKNKCVDHLIDILPSLGKLEAINIRMSKETRVDLEAANRFKSAVVANKNLRKKLWNGQAS